MKPFIQDCLYEQSVSVVLHVDTMLIYSGITLRKHRGHWARLGSGINIEIVNSTGSLELLQYKLF